MMKGKIINKKSVSILAIILVTITVYFHYNSSVTYFGLAEISELKHHKNEYTVTLNGDFGVRTSSFNDDDSFTILENEKPREGNMADIWQHLSEGEAFHVLLKAYTNRNQFDLKNISVD